jgi:uncharacterized protein
MKLLLLAGVIAIVYFFFIKKKSATEGSDKTNSETQNNDMVECCVCKTYISLDDAIMHQKKYYCSIECLERKQ